MIRSTTATCPKDTLKLRVCASLLGSLIGILPIGKPAKEQCCSLIQGLIDLDAEANFGPIDKSVLHAQDNHRSEDVHGDPDITLIVRRGILQCGHIEIDTHLITTLVERWRPETHTFHFSVGEATITLQDIAVIWALPIEGNLITGVDTKLTKQQWQNYCHQWLGFQPNENSFKNGRIKLAALLDRLLNHTCDDDSPFEEVLQEARICVMCLSGGLLCPDATGNTVSFIYLRHMKNIDEESTSNWGTAVLAYLYRELCTASQRGKTNIGGVMQLLQIWAWSRIITLAPIPSNNMADLMPTIDDPENILPVPPYARRWLYHISRTHTAHNAIRIIRNTLDRMQENEGCKRAELGQNFKLELELEDPHFELKLEPVVAGSSNSSSSSSSLLTSRARACEPNSRAQAREPVHELELEPARVELENFRARVELLSNRLARLTSGLAHLAPLQ
ncbi:UNVERIFIED_CONTAM: Serine/threonine-protein phosphatase 7 long form [Sesamum latifolium]|uniref:Serine/threonine-protein phosphatase 7 long form n=1 Tax=Sesamum latifolium TaxID=2727402 RepID=A0AAW2SS63_9LAMI